MFINESRVGNRVSRLAPEGVPRYLRIYDNGGKTFDRFTAIFTGRWKGRLSHRSYYRGMSEYPMSPQGFGQWGEAEGIIDRPGYSHLGRCISFEDLPRDCREVVLRDYCDLWDLHPLYRARDAQGGLIGVFDDAQSTRQSLVSFLRKTVEKAKESISLALDIERFDSQSKRYESVAGYRARSGPNWRVEAIDLPSF